jgi:hypothetical protein
MLTIKNIADIKLKEFHFADTWWVLYGVDVSNIEYRFMFIPMEAGRYDTQKMRLVLLDRTKHNRRGYRLWTTEGIYTYIHTKDIPNWGELVKLVYQAKMIYVNN